jgi:hypothetical protein
MNIGGTEDPDAETAISSIMCLLSRSLTIVTMPGGSSYATMTFSAACFAAIPIRVSFAFPKNSNSRFCNCILTALK